MATAQANAQTEVVIRFGPFDIAADPETVGIVPGNSIRFVASGGAVSLCLPDNIGELFDPEPEESPVEIAAGDSIRYTFKDAGGRSFALALVPPREDCPRTIDAPAAGSTLQIRGWKKRGGPGGIIND